jgi:dihydroflavonol-4-reductase
MVPRLGFGTCDVRDVAEAHVAALERDAAIGGRHPIFDRFLWFSDMAGIVARTLPNARIASREAPDFFVRAMSIFDPSIRQILPFLGQRWEVSNDRMIEVLGVTPRDASAAVADTATYVAGLS